MKTSVSIAAAVAVALAGAGAANAAAIVPSTNNGSLMFFITDATKSITYTAVLTQDVNSYFTSAQATSPAPTNGVLNTINGDAGFTVNLSTDTNLTGAGGFLSQTGSDALTWGIIAGAYTGTLGSAQRPTGKMRLIGTSDTNADALAFQETQIVNAAATGLNNDVQALNLNLGVGSSTASGVICATGSAACSFYGSSQVVNNPVGSATTLYAWTGNGSGNGSATAYSLGTASFGVAGADILSFTGNGSSPVPLPAAFWLFGSGLLGLAGISRRRAGTLA